MELSMQNPPLAPTLRESASRVQTLIDQLRLYGRVIEASIDGVAITRASKDEDNPIIYVNAAFERMTGYNQQELAGLNPRFMLPAGVEQTNLQKFKDALRKNTEIQTVLRCIRKDGTMFWNSISLAPVFDASGLLTHFVSISSDVTDRIRYQSELERQASEDSLTGLANRNLFNDRLRQAIFSAERHGTKVSVLFIDLDHFSKVVNGLGYTAGDLVLKEVAESIRGCVGDVDTIARLGGDEFAIILTAAETDLDVIAAMTRLMKSIHGHYEIGDQEVRMTCSIGASMFPRDGHDAASLMRKADIALHRAKEGGRNRFQFFYEQMNVQLGNLLSLESRLFRALDRRQLALHFQPQINLANGEIVGAEALLRWNCPDVGMVSPAEFIPVAEDTGLIVPIGEWVIKTALSQVRAWIDAGLPPIRMAVNISPRQFRHKGLIELIEQELVAASLPPASVEVEITEGILMQEPEEAIEMMGRLKEVGLRIALDDFGTGYSSLSRLKHYPINVLKIDQSFVRNVETDDRDAAIVRTIIALADSLKLKTIAEGVETSMQSRLLQSWRCDEGQGYHISRPVTADKFAELLSRQR